MAKLRWKHHLATLGLGAAAVSSIATVVVAVVLACANIRYFGQLLAIVGIIGVVGTICYGAGLLVRDVREMRAATRREKAERVARALEGQLLRRRTSLG